MTSARGKAGEARNETPLREIFLTGIGWTAGSFGGLRLIAFAQTIILARLLSPADFGGFAMASVSVSIGQVFSSVGIGQAIVQSRIDERATLDTAFCINLLRGFFLYTVLFFTAPFIERFYATPGVSAWTRMLALTVVLDSASNVGMALYLKELDYRRAVSYGQMSVLVAVLSGILFAVWIRSAWALVYAQLTASLVQLPFSYWAHPYRPRFRIDPAALRHYVEYGRFVLGSAPLFYLSAHVDEIAVGRRFGSHGMGAYQLAYNLSALPSTYLGELVSGVLFPVFARLQSTPDALRAAYLKTVRHIANLCLPLSVSLVLFADEYIHLVYGSRWEAAIPTLRAFFIYGAIRPVASITIQVFRATGRTEPLLRIAAVNLAVVSWVVFLALGHGPNWMAILISVLSVPVVFYGFELVAAVLDLRVRAIVHACAPAVLSSAFAMAAVSLLLPSIDSISLLPLRLATGLAALGAIYVATLLLLDRPSVDEILELVGTQWARLAGSSGPIMRDRK